VSSAVGRCYTLTLDGDEHAAGGGGGGGEDLKMIYV